MRDTSATAMIERDILTVLRDVAEDCIESVVRRDDAAVELLADGSVRPRVLTVARYYRIR